MKPNIVIAILIVLVFVLLGAYFVTNRQNTGSAPEEKTVVAGNMTATNPDRTGMTLPAPVTNPLVSVEGERLAAVEMGGRWGYVDSTGKLAIEPQYNDASAFSDGLAYVQIADEPEKLWAFVDPKGRRIINISKIDVALNFSEGLSAVFIGDNSGNGTFGYIDKTGAFVIKPQFRDAKPFSEGLAEVATGGYGSVGYIDKAGRMVISPQFDGGFPFSEGLAAVKVGGKYGYIDPDGNMVIDPQFELSGQFSGGVAFVKVDGKTGYIDKTGKYLINPRFDDVFGGCFSEGMDAVKIGSKWGFIDKVGNVVISPRFDHAEGFVDGLAVAKVDGKFGYIGKEGTFVISPQFDNARGFSEGFAAVKIGGKWGYVNKTGKIVINPQFDNADSFFQSSKSIKPEM